MDDPELLQWAAKAAGFGEPEQGRTCWTESEYPRRSGKHGALWNYSGHMDTAELWNPLTDDGDALRLAVKLRLSIKNDDLDGVMVGFAEHQMGAPTVSGMGPWYWKEWHKDSNPEAATRRAIVVVAAEIGKAIP